MNDPRNLIGVMVLFGKHGYTWTITNYMASADHFELISNNGWERRLAPRRSIENAFKSGELNLLTSDWNKVISFVPELISGKILALSSEVELQPCC